ncbi:MAG: hypothetical protein GYA55_05570 [SAR324 cluster bacterium]|uniref:Uncharacterized protein n=1 Tax=SAR324 cluster bacterium TaxID=2024889 RepID=A0A7X9IJY8_9DELT|nr:hypothetical protein [SAR324 cluster bacterium]
MPIQRDDDNLQLPDSSDDRIRLPLTPSGISRIHWVHEIKDVFRFRIGYELQVLLFEHKHSTSGDLPALGRSLLSDKPYELLCQELVSCVGRIVQSESESVAQVRSESSEHRLPPWFTGDWVEISAKIKRHGERQLFDVLSGHIKEMRNFAKAHPSESNILQNILHSGKDRVAPLIKKFIDLSMVGSFPINENTTNLFRGMIEDQIQTLYEPLFAISENWERIFSQYNFGFKRE